MTTEITDVEDAGTWRGNIEKIFIDIIMAYMQQLMCLQTAERDETEGAAQKAERPEKEILACNSCRSGDAVWPH